MQIIRRDIEEHCTRYDKQPYVCNGCSKRGKCHLAKMLYDARQALTEGTEEMLSEFINNVGDELIMRDRSSMNLYMQELMASGMSEEEALRKAAVQF